MKDDKNAIQPPVYKASGAFPELTIAVKVSIGKELATNRKEVIILLVLHLKPTRSRQILVIEKKNKNACHFSQIVVLLSRSLFLKYSLHFFYNDFSAQAQEIIKFNDVCFMLSFFS